MPSRTTRTKPSKYIPVALRRAIEVRDRFVCVYCLSDKGPMTIDHVIPRVEGGPTSWSNCLLACKECNDKKAGWPVDLYAELLSRGGRHFAKVVLARVHAALSRPMPASLRAKGGV